MVPPLSIAVWFGSYTQSSGFGPVTLKFPPLLSVHVKLAASLTVAPVSGTFSPSQIDTAVGTLTSGVVTRLIVTESVIGPVSSQGLSGNTDSVSVTLPAATSLADGVYVGVSVLFDVKVPVVPDELHEIEFGS